MIALLLLAVPQDTVSLDQAVRRALLHHPSVAVAAAQKSRADAEAYEARSARLPQLLLDASAFRFQEPMVVQPLHGFDPQSPPLFNRTLFQSGVSLGYTLLDFGARGSRLRAARAIGAAASASLGAAQQALVARTARAYLAVLTAGGVLAAQDQRLRALEAETARVRRLFSEGKAARVEVLRVEAEQARAAAERIGVAGQLTVARQELAQLLGRDAEPAPVALADTAPPSREAALARARAASPELLEAARRSDAARALHSASRAAWLPELRLTGGYVDRGSADGDFRAEWQAGLALAYPLFTGGRRAGAVRKAAAEARAAAELARLAELDVALGVDRALAAVAETHARVAALLTAVEQSEEVARIERLALDVGSGTQTDYLDAEAQLLRARAGLIEARHAEIAARVELARLTGELSPDWLASTLTSNR